MANNHIEIEAKVLISESEYKKIKESVSEWTSFVQTNFYIDTVDRYLKQNKIALRIRLLGGEYTLTLKTPMSEGLLEKNEKLSAEKGAEMIYNNVFPEGEICDFLELLDIDVSKLVVIAQLKTERNIAHYKTGQIALDKNEYSGIVDYELEIEDSSMASARNLVDEFLGSLKIKYKFNEVSKQARAVEASLKSHSKKSRK